MLASRYINPNRVENSIKNVKCPPSITQYRAGGLSIIKRSFFQLTLVVPSNLFGHCLSDNASSEKVATLSIRNSYSFKQRKSIAIRRGFVSHKERRIQLTSKRKSDVKQTDRRVRRLHLCCAHGSSGCLCKFVWLAGDLMRYRPTVKMICVLFRM